MRAVIQRVSKASVSVGGVETSSIEKGLLALIGVERGDSNDDIEYIVGKFIGLRVFADDEGKMNLSVHDISGALLVISQFTLLGDVRKGRRPSFNMAEEPYKARSLFDELVLRLRKEEIKVCTGEFGEMMDVALVNDGPVTILLESRKKF